MEGYMIGKDIAALESAVENLLERVARLEDQLETDEVIEKESEDSHETGLKQDSARKIR